ncbi:hypothetical protein N7G274_001891 [Stereocaulon virgatum]|uniref:Uncharacterized protein n=1 Tax=Stereocaulon virgatum TaxID=373712 RepID=A0ABR4AP43_9LECA
MSHQAPNEMELTQDGEWQLIESGESNSKDHGSYDPKDADVKSQASSSTLVSPFQKIDNNRVEPTVPPITTTAEAQAQTQKQRLAHYLHSQNNSSVYTRTQASAQAHANKCYQAYTQNDLELQTLLDRKAEIEAQLQAQAQEESQLQVLVQITLSDGTVYMFPSHHTFWCYEYDGAYTIRTLASVMSRAEVGDWPGYWLRGQAEMANETRTVETTRGSQVHRRTEHSDGSSEKYRKTPYQQEVRAEPSGGQHSHHHSGRALPSSSRSSTCGHHTPHRLAIEATPHRSPSNYYEAAALRAPSALSYGGGPPRTLCATPSVLSYGGDPTRKLHPTPCEAVDNAYLGPTHVTSRNINLQGGGGGGRRVSSTVAPCDSASNVTPRGHGPDPGHSGSRVSSVGDGGTPGRVGKPHGNLNLSFQYCARDGHWTTQTLAQIVGSHGQWYQIPGNLPYFVAD